MANKASERSRLLANEGREDQDPESLLGGKDAEDRIGFIRKVYAILSIMITFTFGCIAMTKGVDDLNDWMRN